MATLAYILAASHSGSTLLAMLLGSHPDVCTVGELKATSLGDPERYRCSCGARIRECAFWRDLAHGMAARGFDFDVTRAATHITAGANGYHMALLRPLVRGPLLEMVRDAALALSPSWTRHLDRFHDINRALVDTLARQTGARVVVDSSKVGIRLKYLLRDPALDVRVVRLVRDGRAVSLTYTDPVNYADARDPTRRAGGEGGSRDEERLSVAKAAREWRRSNEEADAVLRRVDAARQITISYEALCRDTSATLASIWRFLGVTPRELSESWRQRPHHVIGNGMRFDTDSEVRLDDRWRTALGPDALAAFDAEAGALNRRFGYA